MRNILRVFLVSALLTTVAFPASAFQFTKGYIISDKEAEDKHYLSADGVQAFLEQNGSVLSNYTTKDIDGETRTAAEIINAAAKKYDLNPLFFLVMGQKESSAITSRSLSNAIQKCWLGYASCASDRSFTEQTYAMGKAFRNRYLRDLKTRGYTVSGWAVGREKRTVDGVNVTPQNDITAAMYTYNPLVGKDGGGDQRYGANSAFQRLWENWYLGKKDFHYRSGSLLRIGDSVYLIQGNKKHRFASLSSLLANYDSNKVIPVSAVVGERYKDGYEIKYPAYSLLQSPDGSIYLYAGGKKRGFTSRDAFKQYGFNPAEIIQITQQEASQMPNGTAIHADAIDPRGALAQNKANGAVFYITPKGKRRAITSRELMDILFPGFQMQALSPQQLDKYPQGKPVLLKDGMIVTSPNAKSVFFISKGKKHAFPSKRVFRKYGYNASHVRSVSDEVLKMHQKGKPMRLKKTATKKKSKSKKK